MSKLISLIVPTYNVSAYLPEFLRSIDLQRGGLQDVEIIFCDDGSPDDSAQIIQQWMENTPSRAAQMVRQENGGLSSARNAGLAVASGEWVNFPDPDDILSPSYLETICRFLRSGRADSVDLVAASLVYYYDQVGKVSNTHPLSFKFQKHHQIVNLDRRPEFIHLHANTGFYRRERLERLGLRFDGRIKPNFEDAHLTTLYLADSQAPRIALIEDAVYFYRRRADGSSLVQGSWGKEDKYLAIPRYGWLDLLRRTQDAHGKVPVWVQNVVLYDVSFYFGMDNRVNSPIPGLPPEVKESFWGLLEEIFCYIDREVVEDFRVIGVSPEIRRAILVGLFGTGARPAQGYLDTLDEHQEVMRLRYFHGPDRPLEEIRARGRVVEPMLGKDRPIGYFGRVLMYERTVWLQARGRVSVALDGKPLPLTMGMPQLSRFTVEPNTVWQGLAAQRPPFSVEPAPQAAAWVEEWQELFPELRKEQQPGPSSALRTRLSERALARLPAPTQDVARRVDKAVTRVIARSPYGRSRYSDAWLLMDRDTHAQDNAEHLYRYLRDNQPDVNAWFVLSPDSTDWPRLEAEGFKLLAHRSREHTAALLQCRHVISSQIDHYVTSPLDQRVYGPRTWLYTFLQHGVTKDDLSFWINPKPISLMISATPDEHESFVGDGTSYRYTDKEVKLTGFPRHDRLLALARAQATEKQRTLLVMPTWRVDLLGERIAGGNERALLPNFWDSNYATSWRALLESDRLKKSAEEHGWKIAFVPHPNMQGYLSDAPLPAHISVQRFNSVDIQELLVSGGMLVTDYSSLAFEMAYIERPVVYFQFDKETFWNGLHAYRRGNWSYEDQGFGPVTERPEAAVDAIVDVLVRGGSAEPHYANRMAATFPFRDGECCRRTYEAIVGLHRPLRTREIYRQFGDDSDGTFTNR